MKKAFTPTVLLCVCLCVALPVAAQQQASQSKLIEFQMALLKRGPKATPADWDTSSIRQQHLAYVHSLIESGKAMIAGRITDDPELRGVLIFRTKSADEACGWMMADPAVTAGYFEVELHPWWSEDVMKKTTTPQKPMTAYLAFLVRGEKWTPEKTPQTEEI